MPFKLFQTIREKYQTFKDTILGKTSGSSSKDNPKDIYENYIVPFLKYEMSFFGFECFVPNYKLNLRLAIVIADCALFLVLNAIDIWIIWGGGLEEVCFCLTMWFLGWTGLMLSYTGLTKIDSMCEFVKIIYDFGDSLDKNTESEEIQKYVEHAESCKKIILVSCFLCSGGACLGVCYPIVVYLVTGTKMLPFGFFIPGFSTTENPGFIVNYLYQASQCFLTVLSTMQSTFHSYVFFASNVFFQVDNMIIKLDKLNREIERKPYQDGHEGQLSEIIKLHHEFQSYLAMLEDGYKHLFFVNVACYLMMNVIALFVVVNEVWVIGYWILMTLFGLIFVPCAIGTAFENKNDTLVEAVYGLLWYLLTPTERKTFQLFLLGVQTTGMPTCGGVLPLNVQTFRLTYSKIYTFLMFLIDTEV